MVGVKSFPCDFIDNRQWMSDFWFLNIFMTFCEILGFMYLGKFMFFVALMINVSKYSFMKNSLKRIQAYFKISMCNCKKKQMIH